MTLDNRLPLISFHCGRYYTIVSSTQNPLVPCQLPLLLVKAVPAAHSMTPSISQSPLRVPAHNPQPDIKNPLILCQYLFLLTGAVSAGCEAAHFHSMTPSIPQVLLHVPAHNPQLAVFFV